jgi:hypothetical protein
MDESEQPTLPPSLRAVAWFTILVGIGTGLTIIADLFHHRLNLNIAVLEIPAGLGLLRLSRGWRTFTLWMLWAGILAFAVLLFVLIFGKELTHITVNGTTLPQWDRRLLLAACVLSLGVQIWEYRVLTRPDIRRLFGLTSRPGGPPGDRGTGAGRGGSSSGPLPGT